MLAEISEFKMAMQATDAVVGLLPRKAPNGRIYVKTHENLETHLRERGFQVYTDPNVERARFSDESIVEIGVVVPDFSKIQEIRHAILDLKLSQKIIYVTE